MRLCSSQLILLASFLALASANNDPRSSKIKGIAAKDEYKYVPDSEGMWACLGNPEIKISFDKVNDDYCDCPDGSDEPGTAACASKGKFYCENAGFESNYIPSFKVGDGICDYDVCCDGSDEEPGVCENRCVSMRQEKEKIEKERKDIFDKGHSIRQSMLKMVRQGESQLSSERRALIRDIKHLKLRLEELESFEIIEGDDKDNDSELIKEIFQELNDKISKLQALLDIERSKTEKYKSNMEQLEKTLKDMTDTYNHNFNDPAVKEAALFYQDYSSNKANDEQSAESDSMSSIVIDLSKDIDSIKRKVKPIGSTSQSTNVPVEDLSLTEKCNFKLAFANVVDSFLGYQQPKSEERDLDDLLPDEMSATEIKNEIEANKKKIEESQKRVQEIDEIKKENYGPDSILRAYTEKSCILNKVGDYEYKYCPTGLIEQLNSKGQPTKIGKFTTENLKYNEDTKELEIHYIHGAKCWNGPIRKALVTVECGVKDTILSVSEPEVCDYLIKVASPIACV